MNDLAKRDSVRLLRTDVPAWNRTHPEPPIDLSETDLSGADLTDADLQRANLRDVDLTGTNLTRADLRRANLREATLAGANLTGAQLYRANLNRADLRNSNLTGGDLYRAYLGRTDLRNADLRDANLGMAVLVETKMDGVLLKGARVYGISAWDVDGIPADQSDLVITPESEEHAVTVDNLKVAQFVYLLLTNREISEVIDTITSKVVLILGRFTQDRKAVLDRLRTELRNRGLSPILFDFDPSSNQDITDTVTLLARMARFIVADLTDPKSVQQELTLIAPEVMVAIQPIILTGETPWAMFGDLQRRSHWLLPVREYTDLDDLVERLDADVITPAEQKRQELLPVSPS